MFEDSLLESGKRFKDNRRRATTLAAFGLQALLVGLLLLIPLFRANVAAQPPQLTTKLVAPPPPPAALPATKAIKPVPAKATQTAALRTPMRIPEKVRMDKEEAPPPSLPSDGGVVGGIPGGVPGGQLGGVIGGLASSVPPAPVAPPKRMHVSQGVVGGLLVHRVVPSYPPSARQKHVSGAVVLRAVIGKDGNIENVHVVQGDPLLTSAALDAVKQWKYRPYLLNGRPVEVETLITVNFNLNQEG
jgi:protein TonB